MKVAEVRMVENMTMKKKLYDLLVAISGIVMQCLYFFVIYLLYSNGVIREYIYNLFFLYHNSMLIFNMLPIIPLDGFKILNLILSKFFNFNFIFY